MRRPFHRAIDPLSGGFKIARLCLKYIRYKGLRISIIKGEPRALDLDHNAVALFECVVLAAEVDLILLYLIRFDGFSLFKAFAVTASEDLVGNHQLITCHTG